MEKIFAFFAWLFLVDKQKQQEEESPVSKTREILKEYQKKHPIKTH